MLMKDNRRMVLTIVYDLNKTYKLIIELKCSHSIILQMTLTNNFYSKSLAPTPENLKKAKYSNIETKLKSINFENVSFAN